MTIAVTIRNEDSRGEQAVILVKKPSGEVEELAGGQATTCYVYASGSNIEIAERPLAGEMPWISVGLRTQLHAVPFEPPTSAASSVAAPPQTPPADAPPA